MVRMHRLETYDSQGTLLEVLEEPYTPEEERVEDQAQEFNDIHAIALQALSNWSALSNPQKDIILKNLLRWALWKDGRLPAGL